jgi:hypothetical protein
MGMSGVDWEEDCMKWRGKVLTGKKAHWCCEWDFLPVDETTPEFECCLCFPADLIHPNTERAA